MSEILSTKNYVNFLKIARYMKITIYTIKEVTKHRKYPVDIFMYYEFVFNYFLLKSLLVFCTRKMRYLSVVALYFNQLFA